MEISESNINKKSTIFSDIKPFIITIFGIILLIILFFYLLYEIERYLLSFYI